MNQTFLNARLTVCCNQHTRQSEYGAAYVAASVSLPSQLSKGKKIIDLLVFLRFKLIDTIQKSSANKKCALPHSVNHHLSPKKKNTCVLNTFGQEGIEIIPL